MDDAGFNPTQGSPTGGDTGFDYFGAPPASAPSGQPQNSFAGPQSQFGGPVTYGAPPVPPPPQRFGRSGRSKALVIIVGLVVVLGGVRLWNSHQHARAITLPATFNGQSPNLDGNASQLKSSLLTQWRAANPGIGVNAEIYGTNDQFTILGAARGQLDVKKDLTDARNTTPVVVGDTMCVSAINQSYVGCERSSSSLTVFVLARGSTQDVAAALVDSAYGQF